MKANETNFPLKINKIPNINIYKNSFNSKKHEGKGELNNFRTGVLNVNGKKLETPVLFPVVNIITGPPGPTRTGGIWRWIKKEMLLSDKYPRLLSQILHFSDFPIAKKTLDRWVNHQGKKMTLNDWVNKDQQKILNLNKDEISKIRELNRLNNPVTVHDKIMFFDSGGFKLLYNSDFDIEDFGFEATPKSVLDLQLTFGGDIIASLDYPIPPGLAQEEVEKRMDKSIENALTLMRLLEEKPLDDRPFPFLAVHGQNGSEIRRYVIRLLNKLTEEEFTTEFGLAIGSLVPRRHDYVIIVDIVSAVVRAIKEHNNFDESRIPIHVFGVSGDMIPILSYLGADSFDSNSYVQAAQNLNYFDHQKNGNKKFYKLEWEDVATCTCPLCNSLTRSELIELKQILHSKPYKEYSFRGNDINKSWVYAYLALHNLKVSMDEVDKFLNKKDSIEQYLADKAKSNNKFKKMLSYLAEKDNMLKTNLNKQIKLLEPIKIKNQEKEISLDYTPESFNILKKDFQPDKSKEYLLLVPCSDQKPYSESKSHKAVRDAIDDAYWKKIQKVTFSGLYGPVPEKFETEESVLNYDYQLRNNAKSQINLLTNRLVKFLELYGDNYNKIVAYVTSKAYRKAIEDAFFIYRKGMVLPHTSRMSMNEFYRKKNLEQLINYLED